MARLRASAEIARDGELRQLEMLVSRLEQTVIEKEKREEDLKLVSPTLLSCRSVFPPLTRLQALHRLESRESEMSLHARDLEVQLRAFAEHET